jgi:hypothetical protein
VTSSSLMYGYQRFARTCYLCFQGLPRRWRPLWLAFRQLYIQRTLWLGAKRKRQGLSGNNCITHLNANSKRQGSMKARGNWVHCDTDCHQTCRLYFSPFICNRTATNGYYTPPFLWDAKGVTCTRLPRIIGWQALTRHNADTLQVTLVVSITYMNRYDANILRSMGWGTGTGQLKDMHSPSHKTGDDK